MTENIQPAEQPLPPCSIPASCKISFRDIPEDAEWKDKFISAVRDIVVTCGRVMDLSNLDGLTIGFDYDAALDSVDLGYESTLAKQYTNEGGLVGVGKSLRVRRDGAIQMHIVLKGSVLLDMALKDPECDEFWAAANILAHELGHVQAAGWFEAHSPGVMLAPHKTDWIWSSLRDAAHTIWEEYAACRLSALVSQGNIVTDSYVEGFGTSVSGALERARNAIKASRLHMDGGRVMVETSREIAMPFKMAAYLMGHLDGLEEDVAIEKRSPFTGELTDHFNELLIGLRDVWETRESWDGLASLDPIVDIIVNALRTAGLDVNLTSDPPGSSVSAPYRAETMPNGEADMVIIQMKQTLGMPI
ncbi:hypothetical protein N5F23_21170 [Pseudomonas sichuanensis]|uniref:hypothetical protein n=1 Tax=Pseudomonas sichuanensis TaxID=2213015 RepID=UPI00244CB36D|nr:hypothetical protein [Pseudomonas sichuanensis]MDH0733227.1 hypothetical protein [Pseudomonas sichuanensis]MDH1585101.1 hypothetical protein [Pseudomonas sichuanensis]MDH1594528.1 hypothetical protein [Pseudomonas sichuanensis]MDH1600220.1 hypothetical protein [Pseudomonas sichuanensis]